jgi:hypothetical protein
MDWQSVSERAGKIAKIAIEKRQILQRRNRIRKKTMCISQPFKKLPV